MAEEIQFKGITTRGGDQGESSLFNGERRPKDDLIFEALGDLDELNCWLGRLKLRAEGFRPFLETVQKAVSVISSLTATPADSKLYAKIGRITAEDIIAIERKEKQIMDNLVMPPLLITPGKNEAGVTADITRTIARRCERRLTTCINRKQMDHLSESRRYLNRLSDYLFVLARELEKDAPL